MHAILERKVTKAMGEIVWQNGWEVDEEFCFFFIYDKKLVLCFGRTCWKVRSGRQKIQWTSIVVDNGSSCQYSWAHWQCNSSAAVGVIVGRRSIVLSANSLSCAVSCGNRWRNIFLQQYPPDHLIMFSTVGRLSYSQEVARSILAVLPLCKTNCISWTLVVLGSCSKRKYRKNIAKT